MPFTGGYSKAGLSDGVKCGLFWCDGWYHLPLGKSGGHVWAEGGDEGGIDVRLVVDLASVQGHAWEKSERRRREKKPGSPVRGSAQLPQPIELQSKKRKKKKRERETRKNMYFIVFLKWALGTVVTCLKSSINMSRALTSATRTIQVSREHT